MEALDGNEGWWVSCASKALVESCVIGRAMYFIASMERRSKA